MRLKSSGDGVSSPFSSHRLIPAAAALGLSLGVSFGQAAEPPRYPNFPYATVTDKATLALSAAVAATLSAPETKYGIVSLIHDADMSLMADVLSQDVLTKAAAQGVTDLYLGHLRSDRQGSVEAFLRNEIDGDALADALLTRPSYFPGLTSEESRTMLVERIAPQLKYAHDVLGMKVHATLPQTMATPPRIESSYQNPNNYTLIPRYTYGQTSFTFNETDRRMGDFIHRAAPAGRGLILCTECATREKDMYEELGMKATRLSLTRDTFSINDFRARYTSASEDPQAHYYYVDPSDPTCTGINGRPPELFYIHDTQTVYRTVATPAPIVTHLQTAGAEFARDEEGWRIVTYAQRGSQVPEQIARDRLRGRPEDPAAPGTTVTAALR